MDEAVAQSWWSRNAKWAVPVTVLVVLLAIAAFVAGIFALVFGMMKSTTAYREAVVRASANPAVIAALGRPITAGFFTSGSIKTNGASGAASLSIPISGPDGAATIYVEATQSAGQWTFSKLVVEIAGTKQRIDLLAEPLALASHAPMRSSWHARRTAIASRFATAGEPMRAS